MTRKTSVAIYHEIEANGLLSRLRFEVYSALFHHGPLTQGELWSRHFAKKQRHSICPRFNELHDLGVIECIGERPCDYTGVVSMIWDVTDLLPRKIQKTEVPPTKTQVITHLYSKMTEICTHLEQQNIKKPLPEQWQLWVNESKEMLKQCEHFIPRPK